MYNCTIFFKLLYVPHIILFAIEIMFFICIIKLHISLTHFFFIFCRILFRTLNHQYDYTFDWTMLKQKNIQALKSNHQGGNIEARDEAHEKEKQQPTTSELK